MFKLKLKGVKPYRLSGTYYRTNHQRGDETYFRVDGYADGRLHRLQYTYLDDGNGVTSPRLVKGYIDVKDLELGIGTREYLQLDEEKVPEILHLKKKENV